jgi:hypothetical protein
MKAILRNVFAVITGLIVGSFVNMGIVMISGSIIPPPDGVDVTSMEGLKASIHLFEPRHFIFPFLAHAIGVLVGSFLAYLIAGSHKMKFAIGIGAFFLIGGIANVMMISSPLWFTCVDLIGAYFPMAWIGAKLAQLVSEK